MKKVSLFMLTVLSIGMLAATGCGERNHGDQLKSDVQELGHDAKRAINDATD